ncbi:retrovirus-related Pol polyprotein from transposon 297 [Nephila pilipes]|uniref:Retrovirus-related Pol polyprotein from transposon 297 n=1 Tax=Nephila pilipes TaxID=299642 RepID=A0A8X6NCU5_NEPPI|nr:retrovirus-related Pol polyprotein from transposon 297 [Nephila pilipes]
MHFSCSNRSLKRFLQHCFLDSISCFGVPEVITTDRSNFESDLFPALTKFLGTHESRTITFRHMFNSLVGKMHRQLKLSIKSYATLSWFDVLPTILLGMHFCLTEDICA